MARFQNSSPQGSREDTSTVGGKGTSLGGSGEDSSTGKHSSELRISMPPLHQGLPTHPIPTVRILISFSKAVKGESSQLYSNGFLHFLFLWLHLIGLTCLQQYTTIFLHVWQSWLTGGFNLKLIFQPWLHLSLCFCPP